MFFKSKKSKSKPEHNGAPAARAKGEAAEAKSSPEQIAELKKQATKSKNLQATFGEIVGLLMGSPQFKKMPLAALEHIVLPAINAGQFQSRKPNQKKAAL